MCIDDGGYTLFEIVSFESFGTDAFCLFRANAVVERTDVSNCSSLFSIDVGKVAVGRYGNFKQFLVVGEELAEVLERSRAESFYPCVCSDFP